MPSILYVSFMSIRWLVLANFSVPAFVYYDIIMTRGLKIDVFMQLQSCVGTATCGTGILHF